VVDRARAATLVGGALILREVARRLDAPLQVAGGGLREGAAARLFARQDAA
jgi:exopolyphosphatase/pppGpp-phosphohydrolase